MAKLLNIKKDYLLIGATLLVLLISYKLAFKQTIEAWQLHSNLEKQLVQTGDVSYQPGYLERRNRNLDRIVNLFKADTVNFRSNILSAISSIAEAENVKLAEVPSQDPTYHGIGFTIEKLSFEGDYFALVKTLNKLQQATGIGQIRSASIRSVKSHSSNSDSSKTVMEIYLIISSD